MSSTPRTEIRALTGLRGVAALFVVLYHYLASRSFSSPPMNLLIHGGYLAVDLFFLLSGFVMALSYRHLFLPVAGKGAYGRFLGRRIARVYPLYLLGTLVGFALVFGGWLPFRHHNSLWTLLLQNLLMIQAWGLNASLDFPGWSISAEWAAYLLFPLLLIPTLARKARVAWFAGAVAVAALIVLCLLPESVISKSPPGALLNLGDPDYGFPVYRCIAEFTLGLLAYRVADSRTGKFLGEARWPATLLCVCILVLTCIPRTDLPIVLMFPLLILSLSSGRQLPSRLLETAPAQFFGRISYSIYLIHGLFAMAVNRVAAALSRRGLPHTQTIAAGMGLLVTLAVSTVVYRIVEVPGRHWMRQLFEGSRADRPRARAEDRLPEPGEF